MLIYISIELSLIFPAQSVIFSKEYFRIPGLEDIIQHLGKQDHPRFNPSVLFLLGFMKDEVYWASCIAQCKLNEEYQQHSELSVREFLTTFGKFGK